MMNIRHFFFLLLASLCVVSVSASSSGSYDQDTLPFVIGDHFQNEVEQGEALRHYAAFFLNTEDFQEVITHAKQLKTLGEEKSNTRYQAYANVYLGQAYLMTNQVNLAWEHLNQSLVQATAIRNDSILSSVYNGLGLFASNVDSDYNSAIAYFFEGLEAAKRASFTRLYNLLLLNISGIYYLKGDPAGITYAQECYHYGHAVGDPFLVLWGSFNSAQMYAFMGEYEEALNYIQEAEFILQSNDYQGLTYFYTLYGNILAGLGSNTEAEDYFKEGMLRTEGEKTSSKANLNLSYGRFLMSQQRYSEAAPLLEEGVLLSEASRNQVFIKQLYEALSDCYAGMSDYRKSLHYYRLHHEHASRLFNEERERVIQQLRVQFEAERLENEAEQAKMEVLMQTRKNQYLLVVALVFLSLSVYILILFIKKNKLYRTLIIRNKSAITKQNELKARLENLKQECPGATEKYSVSSLTDDKKVNLFKKAEYFMHEKELYRDPLLTKEKMADVLETNRTYLSQVINERTGLSVPQYINSYRTDEAVRILSDPTDKTPLKALATELGFNSTSTFYSTFQASMGMPPAFYRKKANQLFS
jgi:AraC-like DNA-binding protein